MTATIHALDAHVAAMTDAQAREELAYHLAQSERAGMAVRAEVTPLNAATSPALTPREAYIAHLAPGSRAGQESALKQIAIILGRELDERLRYQDAVRVRGALLERGSPAYARKILCALRGIAKQARLLGLGDEDALRAVEEIEGVKGGSDTAAGRSLSDGEKAAILAACDDGAVAGLRDGVVCALLLCAGLRRAEIADLDTRHVTLTHEGATIQVHGKGAKVRALGVPRDLAARLAAYAQIRGDSPGPLLCAVTRGDRLTSQGISGDAIYQILAKRAELAGVEDVRPHDCRRTVITSMLDAGVDIGTASLVAGHKSVNTTLRYDMSKERRARAALLTLDTGAQRATTEG